MATSMSMSMASGYPTTDTVRVNVSFSVTYAAKYYTYFELYNSSGRLVDSSRGTTYSMSAGGNKSGIYKTFYDLYPDTYYYIVGSLWNADTGTRLSISEPRISFTTDEAEPVASTYFGKVDLMANGGSYNGYSSWSYEGWMAGWDSYANISIPYADPGFTRAGYRLAGFSTSSSATTVSYAASGTATVRATSTDEDNPTTLRLYAVWTSARPYNWTWYSTVKQGLHMGLTALEWNDFIGRIKEFAKYKEVTLDSRNLTNGAATSGTTMYAYQANAVRALIRQLNPPIAVPAEVTSNTSPITAAFVNGLKDSLNSIP